MKGKFNREVGLKDGVLTALLVIILFAVTIPLSAQENSRLDSLCKLAYKQELTTTELADAVRLLSINMQANADSVIKFAVPLSQQAISVNDSFLLARVYNATGTAHLVRGKFARSLDFYQKAQLVFTKINNLEWVANMLNNQALVYKQMYSLQEADSLTLASYEIYKKIGSADGQLMSLVNYAINKRSNKEFEVSKTYYNQAINLASSIAGPAYIGQLYSNYSVLFVSINQYDSAYFYAKKGYELARGANNVHLQSVVLINLGDALNHLARYEEAKLYLDSAYTIAFDRGIVSHLQEIYRLLAINLEGTGDYKSALKFSKFYQAMRDSIISNEDIPDLLRVLSNAKEQANLDKIEAAENAQQLQSEVIDAQQRGLLLLTILIVGGIIFTISAYRSAQKTKKLNKDLEANTGILEQQKADLEQLNTTKAKLISVIGHDLKTPIGNVKSMFDLLREEALEIEEKEQILHDLGMSVDHLIVAFDNILKWVNREMKAKVYVPSSVNIEAMITHIEGLYQYSLQTKAIRIERTIDSNFNACADEDHLNLVMRNIISNAIKFSPQNGIITLAAHRQGDRLNLTIADQGQGMADSQIQAFQHQETIATSLGTKGETGTGLGLMLSQEYVNFNHGSISIASDPGKGTTITIDLPVCTKTDDTTAIVK